jgi:Transposase
LLLRARVSVSCYWRKPWRRRAVSLPGRGLPLQEVAARMKVMHERVAGIDVHKKMIKVAVRSPGAKPWTRKTEVLTFSTFYGVLQAMARELRRRGVTHVAMEASGVYTEPVYYALCEEDFTEVLVVNPAHVKAVKGHKTDLLTEPRGVTAAQRTE